MNIFSRSGMIPDQHTDWDDIMLILRGATIQFRNSAQLYGYQSFSHSHKKGSQGWFWPRSGQNHPCDLSERVLAGDMCDMPLSRAPHGRLGILGDDAAGPAAIDPVEGVWLDRGDDPAYCAGVERDLVGVAVHEADKAPVGHYI